MTSGSPTVLRYAAFTDHGRGGNPAGVVLDASSLAPAEMLAIAADVGFSETAFLFPEDAGRAAIRYFSPLDEVAFRGHATIATAAALAERLGPGFLHLTSAVGPVPVTTDTNPEGITASLTSPPASSAPADTGTVDEVLHLFGWDRDDLDPAYPVHVFWAESPTLFHARDAVPPGGVVEDPATGAAASAFGGYLRTLHGDRAPHRFTILQGHHMGAPSRLVVDLDRGDSTVAVTGTATRLDG